MSTAQNSKGIENARDIIDRFGGIRPMARILGVPATTVQGWNKRNMIPSNRRDEILQSANENNIKIEDLMSGSDNANSAASTTPETSPEAQAPRETPPETPAEDRSEIDFDKIPNALKPESVTADSNDNRPGNTANTAPAAQQATQKTGPTAPQAPRTPQHTKEPVPPHVHGSDNINMKIVMTSFLVSLFVFLTLGGIGIYLILPKAEDYVSQIDRNAYNLETTQKKVAELDDSIRNIQKAQSSPFKGLIPGGLSESILNLKDQTAGIQSTIESLQAKAGQLQEQAAAMQEQGLTGASESMSNRLNDLEEQVRSITGSIAERAQSINFLSRFESLSKTDAGQEQIEQSVEQLNSILPAESGYASEFDEIMSAVQGDGGAIAVTMEGVTPENFQTAATGLALTQFSDALSSGASFNQSLSVLKSMLGSSYPEINALIEQLGPISNAGISSPSDLSRQLESLSGDIVGASISGGNASMQDKAAASMNDFLKVEKNGELLTGTDTQKILVQTQRAFQTGDIQKALDALSGLDGGALSTAMPLIKNATSTLNARKLETQLRKMMQQGLK